MAKTSIVNWVPAAILSSPAHRILSGKRLVLSFTGRRSGTRCATPVNYLQRGSELLITTDSRWWHNLAGGAPVGLRLRGRRVQASAEAIRDPETVAEALTATQARRRRGIGHELREVVLRVATDLLGERGDAVRAAVREPRESR